MDIHTKNWFEVSTYKWVSECEDVITSWDDCKEFVLHQCILDWSKRRTCSRGGWYHTGPGINMAMAILSKHRTETYRMYEYASFDASPVIGGFYADDVNLIIGMTVCHEMAHAVQYYRIKQLGYSRGRPHGDNFKTPYALIRQAVFNHKLPNQKLMKAKYESMLQEIVKPNKFIPLASTKELNHLFGLQ